ncbi:MAG TPA: HAMP domain-containing sensor histidine kinase [Stellaceae bacterium]|nr:HAMP domain-containing sensor histidine kinase [Stellaceae bacterium]
MTKSTTTPDSDTAGPSPPRAAAAVVRSAARRRRWRFHRSLSAKAALLVVIFVAVPLIVYDQFRAADGATGALLMQEVRDQGRVMAQALLPVLGATEKPSIPDLGNQLQRFAGDTTRVKVIFRPTDQSAFYYVASWPTVSTAQLDNERSELAQQGVLDKLSQTCEGELPFAFRYSTQGAEDEVVTSVTPIKVPSGCWAVVTSFAAGSYLGSHLGRPYWMAPEVRIAAIIYLVMAVVTLSTFWGVRRGLNRFAERARAIRERRPGVSFAGENEVPELADVATEFDRMVSALDASAREIRRTAEDNAHAFKTPIAVIRQSLEPLSRAIPPDNPRGQRALGLIENSLDRLDGLVSSARRLDEAAADLINTPRTAVNLSMLLHRLLHANADAIAERQLALDGHIPSGVIIYANEEMIETVLENIVDNALSFSPKGGSIEVRLDRSDRMAEVTIADTGPGVSPENLERIFDRYFSRRPGMEGQASHFGIGLWIARRNIEAVGGTIRAENRPPHGLLVRIDLPLLRATRPPGE